MRWAILAIILLIVGMPIVFSDGGLFDPMSGDPIFTRLANPEALPASTGRGVVFSNDGVYMAVAHATTPFVTIYKRDGYMFTKLDNPTDLPTGQGNGVAFSPDGTYLAVAHTTAPNLTIYKRSGDTFTKLVSPNGPDILPTGAGNGVAFSADGSYLAVAHATTPNLTLYSRSGDVFTKITPSGGNPNGTGNGVAFSADGRFMAVASGTSPFLTIYNSTTFAKINITGGNPAGVGNGVAFSNDGNYVSIAHATTPFVSTYKLNGSVFSKLPNPTLLPASTGNGVRYSNNDSLLAVVHATTPFVTVYNHTGDNFTKLSNPSALPAGTGQGVDFYGSFMAVAHATTPFVTVYKIDYELASVVYVDDDADPGWYDSSHVKTIQEGIYNVTDGGTIYVYGGTYPEKLLVTGKNVSIIGNETDYPIINPSLSNSTAQFIFDFPGSRFTLSLQYLNISNQWGGATTPVHIGLNVPAQNNLIIDHCILHDVNQIIKTYGNITFTNNTAYNFKYRVVEGSWSSATYALQMIARYNIIYDSVTGDTGEAIKAKYGHWYGDISYNYIAGNRIGIWIDPEPGIVCKFGGNWTITHNTIDNRYNTTNPGNISQGISFTSVDGNFHLIDCRDNIINGANYYAIYHGGYSGTGEPYANKTIIKNSLFNNTNWFYWNTSQMKFQWNGTGYSEWANYSIDETPTIAGWAYSATTGYLFEFDNCSVADPKFLYDGSPGQEWWSLRVGSPALGTASDGTNIGAWQGTPTISVWSPSPANGSTRIPLSTSEFTFNINTSKGIFNWTMETNPNIGSGFENNVGNKTVAVPITGLNDRTTYTVYINVTDGTDWERKRYTFTTATLNVYVDDDADPSWYDATHVETIAEGTTTIDDGGTVYVWDGYYNENFNITKSINLLGNGSENVEVKFLTSSTFGCTITASDVLIDGFYFWQDGHPYEGIFGIPRGGSDPYYTIVYDNITFSHCEFYHGRRQIFAYASNFTVSNCTFKDSYRDTIYGQFHTATFEYNHFINAGRKSILFEGGTLYPNCKGDIIIRYNTMYMGQNLFVYDSWGNKTDTVNLYCYHNSIDSPSSWAMSFFAPTGVPDDFEKLVVIEIRDNIVSNSSYGAVYVDYEWGATENNSCPSEGQIVVYNNLYYNVNETYSPVVTDGQHGYYNGTGVPSGISMDIFNISDIVVGDPLWNDTKHTDGNFAFNYGSPAYRTASDGTNIGAWQGTPQEPPGMNSPPDFPELLLPLNASDYESVYNCFLYVNVSDPDGDSMNVSFYWGNGTLIGILYNITNGTCNLSIADFLEPSWKDWLDHDTMYVWYVNVSDGEYWVRSNETFSFNTSKAWDVNEDRYCNYLDASSVVPNYGEIIPLPGQYGWDIVEDAEINYLDVSSMVLHYGESYL